MWGVLDSEANYLFQLVKNVCWKSGILRLFDGSVICVQVEIIVQPP